MMAVIVIAEDEIHIARVVGLWLRRAGHEVHEGLNGRQALELVRKHQPDLLITDVNMPAMDGIELIMTCGEEKLPKLGTIVLTSRCDQAAIARRLEGLEVLLHPKPFSPTKLTKEVEHLLSRTSEELVNGERLALG